MTTVFEPRVQYRVEQTYALAAFQNAENTGLENISNSCTPCPGTRPYRGIAVHNWWLFLSPEEIIAELAEFETIEFGSPTPIEVAGFPATQIEATVPQAISLWEDRTASSRFEPGGSWSLHADQRVRFVIVETPAGSMLVTISAATDGFDDFLPVAEEILAGISFPDL